MSKKLPLTLIVVLIAALIWSIPFWWILSLSFQPNDILQKTTSNTALGFIPFPFTFENYYLLWGQSFFDWFINSAIIAVTMTVLATILCSLSGYAFARIDFVGKKITDKNGLLVSIQSVKRQVDSSSPDSYHQVDGISGATMTTKGLNEFLMNDLKKYDSYFQKIRMGSKS